MVFAQMLTFENLPIPPSGNNLFPSSKRGGRFISPRYRAWRKEAGLMLRGAVGMRGPVVLEYLFEDGATRADLGNLEKAVTDLLVTHRIIEGDGPAIVRSITLAWSFYTSGLTVRVCNEIDSNPRGRCEPNQC